MGVYIKGMEMPTSCYLCPFCDYVSARCDAVKGTPYTPTSRYEVRADWCPLVPVPPHGRLIDADALIKVLKTKAKHPLNIETTPYSWAFAYECLADMVGDMPTIIPAEEG